MKTTLGVQQAFQCLHTCVFAILIMLKTGEIILKHNVHLQLEMCAVGETRYNISQSLKTSLM